MQGCPSWKWFYPYHYAPFSSDFKNITRVRNDFDKGTTPGATHGSVPCLQWEVPTTVMERNHDERCRFTHSLFSLLCSLPLSLPSSFSHSLLSPPPPSLYRSLPPAHSLPLSIPRILPSLTFTLPTSKLISMVRSGRGRVWLSYHLSMSSFFSKHSRLSTQTLLHMKVSQ